MVEMYRIQILETRPEPVVPGCAGVRRRIRPEPQPEADNVIAARLLCMLTMCVKLRDLCINRSVLMSVI